MLIGLTGAAGCGKTTAAKILEKALEMQEYHYAKPLKDACKIIFDWNDEHMYGDLKEIVDPAYGVSPRMAMQTLGTEWGRSLIHKDIWLIRAKTEIERHSRLVISDVRMDNEAELIIRNGGIIIDIQRPVKHEVRSHSSEAGVSEHLIHKTIMNNGTLEEFRTKLLS